MNILTRTHSTMKTPMTRLAPIGRSQNSASWILASGFLPLACWLLAPVLCLLSLPAARAASSPPDFMTYQGFLVDGNGAVLAPTTPQNFPVVFRIYSAATGAGGRLWSEQQIVTVDKGNFSVVLGEGTPIGGEVRPPLSSLFTGATASDRYISISVTIGGSTLEILPRLRLLPAPYSFLATSAANLVQPNGANAISYANNRVEVTGNVFASGTVAGTFSGNGAGLTDLNASQLTSGVLPDARLSGNVIRGNAANTFSQNQTMSGSLGIGTVPGARLDVLSSTGSRLRVFDFGGGSGSQLVGGWAANSPNGPQVRYERIGAPGFWDVGMVNGDYVIEESDIRRLTVQAGGNVGIGTVAPARRLQIGDVGVGNSEGMIRLASRSGTGGNNRTWDVGVPETEQISTDIGYSFIIDDTERAGTEFMVQWGTGNVGIGTTSPTVPLTVQHNTDPKLRVQLPNGNYAELRRVNGGIGTGGSLVLGLNNSHFGPLAVAVYDGDSNWDFVSDRRFKKDIVDVEPMLDRALQVQVRRYRWKDGPSDSKHMLGVIAQEVQPLFADLVSEMEDPNTKEKNLAVGYGDFALIAIKSLQELKTEKDAERAAFEKEIRELKKDVESLKGRLAQTAQVDTLQKELTSLKQIVQRLAATSRQAGASEEAAAR